MKELEQQLQEHTENQKLVEEDSEKLKARLAEWQVLSKLLKILFSVVIVI